MIKGFKKTKLYQVLRSFWFFQLYEVKFNFLKMLRLIYKKNKYSPLLKLKGIHEGDRCFIIATGPSMTKEDLYKLKDEYTFGVNSLCKIFKEIGWETTYFGVQDHSVYAKLKNDLKTLRKTTLFVSSDNRDQSGICCKKYVYPFNIYNQKTPVKDDEFIYKFSNDIYKEVCGGFTIVYSMIQIAVYMGFKEIYLLGCDCNYSDDKHKRHFIESGHYDPGYKTVGNKMIDAYKIARRFADDNNIHIFNATRGGMLEEFERVDLDEVLNKNEIVKE